MLARASDVGPGDAPHHPGGAGVARVLDLVAGRVGIDHTSLAAVILFALPRFKSTHCGCCESGSPVNAEARYGLLFQYVLLLPSSSRE